ncbi:MAG: tetratricopeptide repeat protein, partial [Planctomycetes bacterium]|nr:tetratricopeptide repeat protein [Planctomycetota bacterium]
MAKVILRVGKAAAGVIAALVVIGFILVTLRSGPPVQAENVLPTDPAVSAAFVQARDYTNNKQYVQAEVVYIDLLSQYPGTDCAFAARNELAYLYVAWEKWSEADTEIGQLAGDFSNNSDLPYALWAIGSRLEKKKQFQRAQSVYQQIVTDYAGTDMAWQAQPRLDFLNVRVNIISVIESGDYAGADTAVNTLISDFAGEQRLAGLLNTIAKSYEIQGEFARAESIFQQVAQGYTNKDGLKAQANLAKLYITGQVAGDADAATDSLARDFSGSRHFAKTLRQVGRKFAETGQYEKSRDIYEQVTTAEPNSLGALQARTDLIRMSISGRGGVRVREAIDELAEGFAGRRQLTGALDNIARTYEKIGRHKEAEGVYQRMAEAQSDNQSASVAQINALKANVLSAIASGDFVTAQEGAERLVADFGVFTELSPTLGSIGQAYIDKAEYDSAYVIFEYIASAWPGSDVELQAQKGVALACLALADETNADVAINKIYSAFSNHKDTAEVIFKLANKCCDIARYDRALNLYQDILTYWPQS